MSYSVQTAKSELEAMLHGTSLSQIVNIDGVFNRAARKLLLDIDPTETKRTALISTPIYYNVFDYTPPTDLKGNKIIDIFPQFGRTPSDVIGQTFNRPFDLNKQFGIINKFTIVSDTGTKTLRIDLNDNSKSIQLNSANSITGNGTWAASGTASNLSLNSQVSINGGNVLNFDITTGTGYLTNSDMTSIDLTNHLNQSGIFWDISIPTGSSLTSLEIRFGTDSSNYYEATAITTNFQGNSFNDGYNQAYTLWSDTAATGSPDVSDIKYIRLAFTVSADMTACWFAQIWSRLGVLMNTSYYSKYLFRDNITGIWQETVTDDSNLINLDTDSYNIFIYLLHYFATQQALGQLATQDINISSEEYKEAIKRYKSMYKSEISKPQETYYNSTKPNYRGYIGRQY